MARQVTKSELEQLLVELSPLPELMSRMSDEVAAMRRDRQADREALVRLEECMRNMKVGLDRLSTSLTETTALARNANDSATRATEQIAALHKIIWAIMIPVLLMIVQSAVGMLTK